ncbi:MAG: septum formation protein [Chlamydiales bacterium]|jgi:septum formation protein
MRLILGSQSPRRKEILGYFKIPFEQIPSSFDESLVVFDGDPKEYVSKIARRKGENLASLYPEAHILTADTIVFANGKVYPKPENPETAFNILQELSGGWHSVFTSVALINGGKAYFDVEETRVLFNDLSPKQIRSYHEAINYSDKAGGYAIQETGSLICKKIEGCYYNVMGLPINTVRELLSKTGIDIWEYVS